MIKWKSGSSSHHAQQRAQRSGTGLIPRWTGVYRQIQECRIWQNGIKVWKDQVIWFWWASAFLCFPANKEPWAGPLNYHLLWSKEPLDRRLIGLHVIFSSYLIYYGTKANVSQHNWAWLWILTSEDNKFGQNLFSPIPTPELSREWDAPDQGLVC